MQVSGTAIKPKPYYWKFIPIFRQSTGIVFGSQIYVSRKIYSNLQTKKPNPLYVAIIEHEKSHIIQKRKMGQLRYEFKFWTSKKFRLREELLADQKSMKYLKRHGKNYPIQRRSKGLSSWVYGKMISQKEAEKKLKRIWGKVDKGTL